MMRSIFTKTLYDMRWTLGAFAVLLFGLSFLVLFIYPSVQSAQQEMLDGISDETAKALVGSVALANTIEGFLSVQLFSFQPLYLSIYAIIVASAAVAGEEGDNTLSFLLARPVSRVRVLTEKALAYVAGLVLITLATAGGAIAGALAAGVDVSYTELAWSIANTAPFGLWVVAFGLFCSAVFRKRLTAALVTTFVVVGSYLLNSLTEFDSSLKVYNQFTPMYHYAWGQPIIDRVQWDSMAILLVSALAFYILAQLAFQRREVFG
jgi:ABC-2 type transport system permease protein